MQNNILKPCGIPKQCDIAIVGGGLVGMSLALLLAQQHQDWHIVLLDKNGLQNTAQEDQKSSFDGRSTALSKGSQTLLESIGVWKHLSHQCAHIQRIQVSDQGRWSATQLSADEFKLDALGYVAENTHFTQALLQQFERIDSVQTIGGVTVNHAAAAIDTDAGQSSNQARKGYCLKWQVGNEQGQLHTRLLLLADGAQSPLRKQLGIDAEVHDYQQSAIVANIRMELPHQGRAFERFTPNGPLALLPLSDAVPEDKGHRMALVWTHSQTDFKEQQSLPDDQWQSRLQKVLGSRLGNVEYLGQRQCFPLQRVVATESVRSHLAVMGNAAHFLHPVAGQGFNLALRDCARLANILGEAWRDQPLTNFGNIRQLNAYSSGQAQDQQLTISGSHGLVKLFGNQSFVARAARSVGLWEMEQMPWLKRIFALHTLGFAPYQVSDGFPSKK